MARRFTGERRSHLVQLVLDRGSLSIPEAAERFDVSTETIRKDIIELDAQGLVKKTRGGAVRVAEVVERPTDEKRAVNSGKKRAIAAKAFELMPQGSSIIIDAGSTPLALAELIAKASGYTVFTNSLPAANALRGSDNQLFMLGGYLRESSGALLGDWTSTQLESIRAAFAVVGTDACVPSGPAIDPYEEVAIKRQIFAAANTSILLADSTKFSRTGAFQFCSWSEVDLAITDAEIDESTLALFQGLVNITVAPTQGLVSA